MESPNSKKPEFTDKNGLPFPVFVRHSFWKQRNLVVRISSFYNKVIEVVEIYQLKAAMGLQKLIDLDIGWVEFELISKGFKLIEEV